MYIALCASLCLAWLAMKLLHSQQVQLCMLMHTDPRSFLMQVFWLAYRSYHDVSELSGELFLQLPLSRTSVMLLLSRTLHRLQLCPVTCLLAKVQHINGLSYVVMYRQWTLANGAGAVDHDVI